MKTYNNDNGGRRSDIERRMYSYAGCLPERRLNMDRRNGIDRRNGLDRRRPRCFGAVAGSDRRKRFRATHEQPPPVED